MNKKLDNASTHETLIGMHKLGGAKLKIFQFLTDGSAKSPEELMQHINCTNKKSFGVYSSSLNSSELLEPIQEDGVKKFQLKEICFPFGRPTPE